MRLWDTATGTERAGLQGHGGWVQAVALSADGGLAASGGDDGTVRLWDTATGTERAGLQGHGGWVRAVALSADGGLAASGGDDGTVRLWDTATGTERAAIRLGSAIFSVSLAVPSHHVFVGLASQALLLQIRNR